MNQKTSFPSSRSPEVDALYASYRSGCASFIEHDAIYAIPSIVLADLFSSGLFTRAQVEAEQAFTVQCDWHFALGFRHGHGIHYGLLTAHSSHIMLGETGSPGLTKADVLGLKALCGPLDSSRERLLGVAGRLNTLPQFLVETLDLRKAFESLPEGERPQWPLRRSIRIPADDPSHSDGKLSPVPDGLGAYVERSGMFEGLEPDDECSNEAYAPATEGAAFPQRLAEHLDKWGLSSLVDWHLPLPDAPLVPNHLVPGSPAEPRHGIHILLPLHYPLQGDDKDFMRRVKEAQRDRAEELKLPADMAGIDNHKEFAQIQRLCHLELVLRSRMPTPPRRGAVALIESVAARVLGITAKSIRRLRTLSNSLRSGKLSSIPRRRL